MSGFSFEDHTNYSVVRFESELHDMSWGDVEAEAAAVAQKLRDASTGNLLVDLSPMDLIQSGLVASMVRMWKATEDHPKRKVVVAAPSEIVNEVLRSAGLFKVFNVVDSFDEAVGNFGASRLGQPEAAASRFPAWGLGLVMLLVGAALGACGILFFGPQSSDESSEPQPSTPSTSEDDADADPDADSEPAESDAEEQSTEEAGAATPLNGDGKLTVRGMRKASQGRELVEDDAAADDDEVESDKVPADAEPESFGESDSEDR